MKYVPDKSKPTLTDEDIKAELKNLERINAAPNNMVINTNDYPKVLGIYSKDGLTLIEKYHCSDVCPQYGGVGIYYQNITNKEECAKINGRDVIDPAWKGYVGCTPEIESTNSFNIYYSFGVGEKNILDTKNNLYTKDMICDLPKQYAIKLSDNEKNQIYNVVIGNDLLNIKEDFTKNCNLLGICRDVTPLSGATLKIELDGKTNTIKWRGNYFDENNLNLKKFMNAEKVISDIISKKEKEMNIEQPKCGYL